jgi:broad specificity phosphatase PhoE
MKAYFVRHGESFDDIYNEYGSWSDRGLTPKGIRTAFEIAGKLRKLNPKYKLVLTSPLKRASQTAEIIGSELGVRVDEDPYLKERNTYGLLTGVNKDLAIEEYPEMNAAFLEGRYLPASERYKDCLERVKILIKSLKSMNYENIICCTHGHIMTIVIEEFLDLIRNSIGDGGILGLEITKNNLKIIHVDGPTFTEDENVARGVELRKFKKD